jgi:hypothetical protein
MNTCKCKCISLSTVSWRHVGGVKLQLHAFLTLALIGGLETFCLYLGALTVRLVWESTWHSEGRTDVNALSWFWLIQLPGFNAYYWVDVWFLELVGLPPPFPPFSVPQTSCGSWGSFPVGLEWFDTGAVVFKKKSRNHLKILDGILVTWSNSIPRAHRLAIRLTWRPEFVCPWCKVFSRYVERKV